MVKTYSKITFALLFLTLLGTSCKDSDSQGSKTDYQSKESVNDSNLQSDEKSQEVKELPAVSSTSSEDTNDSSFNPNKVPAGLKAFSLDEVLAHNDMKGIQLGMTSEELNAYNLKANQSLEEINKTDLTGNIRTHRIVTGGVPIVELSMNGDTVNALSFLSKNAFPKDMIGVDYTYKVLTSKYPNTSVNGNQVRTMSDGKKLIFQMEVDSPDGNSMPASAQIVELTVMNQIES
ncbi:MAG: hypothetical protein WBG46_07635 [Nonlabens sp.]